MENIDLRVSINKFNRNDYKFLQDKFDKDNSRIFMIAMAIGYLNGKGKRRELSAKDQWAHVDRFKAHEKSVIKAIAVQQSKSLEILLDENKKQVYTIAEEYAAEGIELLKEMTNKGYGSLSKRLETTLRSEISEVEDFIDDNKKSSTEEEKKIEKEILEFSTEEEKKIEHTSKIPEDQILEFPK